MRKLLMMLSLLTPPITETTVAVVQPALAATTISKLGDLSDMRKIVADTLAFVEAGETQDAIKRITDYETVWDKNEMKLRVLDTVTWRKLDEVSDVALSTVRSPSAKPDDMKKDLSALIALLQNPSL